MRVIAGTLGGRRLKLGTATSVRPTSDRAREAIFNMLASLGLPEGAAVLDLFAGTGALGIEAISRGAAHAVFVDDDHVACRAITANLETLGIKARAHVVRADALTYLLRSATPNSTTPNSTTPNSTTPNSTTPNSTTPNSSTPNSSTPDRGASSNCGPILSGNESLASVAFADPPYEFDDWVGILRGVRTDVLVCESDREIFDEGCAQSGRWKVHRIRRYGTPVVTVLVSAQPMASRIGSVL